MNTKTKMVPLAASLSLLLWAGCATEQGFRGDLSQRPSNLLEARTDTYRAARTGLDEYANREIVTLIPVEAVVIEEAAGARRPE